MNNNLYVLKELEDKIDKTQVKNTLTETAEGSVLDARQGKVLNDKIDTKASKQELGTLSELTTTKKDNLVSALNEVKQSVPSTTSINQSIDEKVSTHNQSNTSHQDIRNEIKVLSKDRGYLITKQLEDNTDFNDIPKLNGIYMVLTRTNAPMILDYNQWYFVKVTVHNESYLTQEAWTFVGEKSQRWVRVLDNNVWRPWVKMVDVNEFNSLSDQTLYVQNLPFSILKDMTYKKRYTSLTVLTTEQETELGLPNDDGYHWWYFTYEPDVWTGTNVGTQKVKNYHSGNVYERGSDGVFHKIATTTKTNILVTPSSGYKITSQASCVINNIVYLSLTIEKSDGGIIPQNAFVAIVPSTYKPNTGLKSADSVTLAGTSVNGVASCLVSTTGNIQYTGTATNTTKILINTQYVI